MFSWSSRRSPHQQSRVRRFVSSFLRRHLMLTSLFVYFSLPSTTEYLSSQNRCIYNFLSLLHKIDFAPQHFRFNSTSSSSSVSFCKGSIIFHSCRISLRNLFLMAYANVELNSGAISSTGDTKRSVIFLLRKRLTGAMTGFHDVHTYPDVTDNRTRTLLTSE